MRKFLISEYGTGGKGFTIHGQKIGIWYDSDGIRIRRGDSARRNFDRMVTWEEAADRIRDMYEDGNYVSNSISNNAIEKEREETSLQLALHFRDTNKNPDERLSYQEWQEIIQDCWLEPEASRKSMSVLSICRKTWRRIRENIIVGKFRTIQSILPVSMTCSGRCPGGIRNSR